MYLRGIQQFRNGFVINIIHFKDPDLECWTLDTVWKVVTIRAHITKL